MFLSSPCSSRLERLSKLQYESGGGLFCLLLSIPKRSQEAQMLWVSGKLLNVNLQPQRLEPCSLNQNNGSISWCNFQNSEAGNLDIYLLYILCIKNAISSAGGSCLSRRLESTFSWLFFCAVGPAQRHISFTLPALDSLFRCFERIHDAP